MTDYDQEAQKLADRIQRLLARFERSSGHHQKDESFVAVDATRYALTVKLQSPFGNGLSTEEINSTNELQQRLNHWIGVQRKLGELGAVRIVITPEMDLEE